jgi:hypothetical protein
MEKSRNSLKMHFFEWRSKLEGMWMNEVAKRNERMKR